MKQLELKVNGELHSLMVDPNRTLLEVLREDLGLTGAKEACGDGNCGSCTVLLDGQPVASCLVLAVEAQGREISPLRDLPAMVVYIPSRKPLLNMVPSSVGSAPRGDGAICQSLIGPKS